MMRGRKSDLVVVLAIVVAQGLATWLTYSGYGRFLFAGGSDSGYTVVRPAPWMAWSIVVACALVSLVVWRGASRLVLAGAVTIMLAAWVVSGRAVGVGFQFGDRLVAGTFFVRTASIQPVAGAGGAALDVEVSPSITGTLGFVELRTGSRSEALFLGPLCLRSMVRLLRSVEGGTSGLRPAGVVEGGCSWE